MRSKAIARYLRTGNRKVGIVLDLIRGKKVEEALQVLRFCPVDSAKMVDKALRSAIANANQGDARLNVDIARVVEARANFGGMVRNAKRFMPRAMGRASAIHKRMCHLTIVVDDASKDSKAVAAK
jgi:large subunit ribosomal protein L22